MHCLFKLKRWPKKSSTLNIRYCETRLMLAVIQKRSSRLSHLVQFDILSIIIKLYTWQFLLILFFIRDILVELFVASVLIFKRAWEIQMNVLESYLWNMNIQKAICCGEKSVLLALCKLAVTMVTCVLLQFPFLQICPLTKGAGGTINWRGRHVTLSIRTWFALCSLPKSYLFVTNRLNGFNSEISVLDIPCYRC